MNNLDVTAYCDQLLCQNKFKDYCPNGLQVDGGSQSVKRIVSGVTASQGVIQRAIVLKADMLLVHHGYFWKGESSPLTGLKGKRIRQLMQHSISLVAYHLPLDAHSELGNNAQLARRLGFWKSRPIEDKSLIWQHELERAITLEKLTQIITDALDREPLCILGHSRQIKKVAWCTGAAQGYIEQAAAQGADAFISGEISEQTTHLARELGIHYFSAGHHATERYGVQALGEHLAEKFSLFHEFIDENNPV